VSSSVAANRAALIADELIDAGPAVYLSVGRCPWLPQRYRGREIVHWLVDTGISDQTVDTLSSPAARLVCNPRSPGTTEATIVIRGASPGARGGAPRSPQEYPRPYGVLPARSPGEPRERRCVPRRSRELESSRARATSTWSRTGSTRPRIHPPRRLPSATRSSSSICARRESQLFSGRNGHRPDFRWIEMPLFDA
jgi:hypothetical protein